MDQISVVMARVAAARTGTLYLRARRRPAGGSRCSLLIFPLASLGLLPHALPDLLLNSKMVCARVPWRALCRNGCRRALHEHEHASTRHQGLGAQHLRQRRRLPR